METIFSKMLVRLRKEAGFSTAYQFYHSNGGKDVLKIAYRNYLMIEQGRSLPALERLSAFIWGLHMIAGSAEANAFVSAWLQTMAGPEKFKELIEPLTRGAAGASGLSPMQKAVQKSMVARKYFLTPEQIEVMYANCDHYLCFVAMTNDTASWTAKELAEKLKLTTPAAAKALKDLAKVKLLKEVKKGVYSCPISSMLLQYPRMSMLSAELRKKIHDYADKLAAGGKRKFLSRVVLRVDEKDFYNFFPIMDVNIYTASTYNVMEKGEHTALFMVEGKVTKLRDF